MNRIPAQEAIDRFALHKYVGRYSNVFDREDADGYVRVYDGDHHVKGNLDLDYGRAWGGDVGMVVNGNLTVSGNIMNGERNFGAFLVVFGSVQARHLVAGGSSIHVTRDARLAGIILGHYTHGTLVIEGETEAAMIISGDHTTRIRTTSPYSNQALPLSDLIVRIAQGEPLAGVAD
ncbi:MAG TPA: hypothetical protein VF618_18830 [Thermoanaerobaculia bacterium]